MKARADVRVGTIEFQLVARPADHVEMHDFVEEMRDLHNPILRVGEREITSVHTIDRIAYDHSEAADDELVWACEGCQAYSKSKPVVNEHEQTCPAYRELKGR